MDRALGLACDIPREDRSDARAERASNYPPSLTGMRGSGYERAYCAGHALRNGALGGSLPQAGQVDQIYDLVIVGGGISGLSAAWFYRRKHGRDAKILVLDNHDDFGGHAKRNEFTHDGDTRLANGGTFNLYSPQTEAQKLIFDVCGIDVEKLAETTVTRRFYESLGMGQTVFFDRKTFGRDTLLKDPASWTDFTFLYDPTTPPDASTRWSAFLRDAPLPERVKKDIFRLYHDRKDYLPGLSTNEKVQKLALMSYRDYLIEVVGCDPMVCTYLRDRSFGSGRGLDATTALAAFQRFGLPGFDGLDLPQVRPHGKGGAEYHFPEGNATIPRMIVRDLVPNALNCNGLSDALVRRVRYDVLDREDNAVRIRLNATAVNVRNEAGGVAVTYIRDGGLFQVRARSCILACWFHVIPYLCPDMPAEQRDALHYNVHTPNLWVNVWLRNWQAFHKAGACLMNAPGSYYASIILEPPVSVGGYQHSASPDQPAHVSLLRGYGAPGLPIKDQFRAGRIDMYETSFETYERELRLQFNAALGPYGFDAAKDIMGITVNRWGHGYSYWYSPLYDDFLKTGGEPPHLRARRKFGRITIANTDAGGTDSTALAIDMAWRAVNELDETGGGK
ncbi:FAD-dependent oxidoreductase [Gluconacetobacter sp. 1c LMG 22058]|uniref:FAD-dependent oxidoreductase n=2 Tax=Gluconacetobacter dulcium TaxID=2729096 RepID=A0A7W4PIX2_9PROT|nr:FAD-dependent oxidoreductase [Gluconacetobacter dulcium]